MERGLYVLSAAIVLAALLLGGIYGGVQSVGGGLYRLNKFTGVAAMCTMEACENIRERPSQEK